MEVITRAIDKLFPEAKSTRLKQLCPTRWVERHDSILLLQEMLPAVQEALEEVSQWKDVESASMALQLLCALQSSFFIISLQVMARVFSLSLPYARFLRHEHIDFSNAMNMVTNLKGTIEKIRTNAMAESLSTSIKAPRRTGRQTLRCNIETDNPQSYFKIFLFLPFLDHFSNELNSHQDLLKSFECLIPTSTSNAEVTRTQEESFKKLLNLYQEDIQIGDIAAIGELHMWYERVKDLKISSRRAINYYTACHQDVFPTINTLLKILTTLPVSTSTSETSLSSLRRLKTYLRNKTGQQRLNGLAMLNTHRKLDINAAEVLDELAKTPRRLEFRLS
ncbi:52 kDa repressor of the inhibitor of the protein kinase-like [Harmonia axyridis]|uniref:52 kDa repressor of the inhibitor of the protein kinase-like n=1 Tax=Harmonia axyridis TaxID=115357 RepID=UPI001E2758C6|nr:52 kDa repressor of the inhibitor of the protein kinase-like [Harmonia axyridis]